MSLNKSDGTRVNKFLSEAGHCSRREADKLIEKKELKLMVRFPQWEQKYKREIK